MNLRGIRGATVIEENSAESILSGTKELLEELMSQNQVELEEVASVFFSVTSDLNAEFPAVAARKLGFNNTPLLCLNEIPVPKGLQKCVRILLHINSEKKQSEMVHVYLKEAVQLRPDRAKIVD